MVGHEAVLASILCVILASTYAVLRTSRISSLKPQILDDQPACTEHVNKHLFGTCSAADHDAMLVSALCNRLASRRAESESMTRI